MVDRFERFTFAISEISKYWHNIASAEMEKYGLKGPHAIYLVSMYRYPEGITSAQLCELSGKDKADISRAINLMEKKGLVTRVGVNQNLYRALLKLTETGKDAAEHIRKRASIAVEMAGSGLTDENRKIFYESLEYITLQLQEISEAGLPQ